MSAELRPNERLELTIAKQLPRAKVIVNQFCTLVRVEVDGYKVGITAETSRLVPHDAAAVLSLIASALDAGELDADGGEFDRAE